MYKKVSWLCGMLVEWMDGKQSHIGVSLLVVIVGLWLSVVAWSECQPIDSVHLRSASIAIISRDSLGEKGATGGF